MSRDQQISAHVVLSGSQCCMAHLTPYLLLHRNSCRCGWVQNADNMLASQCTVTTNQRLTNKHLNFISSWIFPNPITQSVSFIMTQLAIMVKIFVLVQNQNVSTQQDPSEVHLCSPSFFPTKGLSPWRFTQSQKVSRKTQTRCKQSSATASFEGPPEMKPERFYWRQWRPPDHNTLQ